MNMDNWTGANILSIVTGSLYDKPTVVFREYVQNSVDAFLMAMKQDRSLSKEDFFCRILLNDKNLVFIDNGTGIPQEEFSNRMMSIALSDKDKTYNIGYKGIGRLSGISYCDKLYFINIVDYSRGVYDIIFFDCDKYRDMERKGETSHKNFEQLMDEICIHDNDICKENDFVSTTLAGAKDMFVKRNKGFLVVMEQITSLLADRCNDTQEITEELGWLLPVPFRENFVLENKEMFDDMFDDVGGIDNALPMFKILYNDVEILRPIDQGCMRSCIAERKLGDSAVSFITFRTDKFQIEASRFSGIKLYIDNMLLCDETEIVQCLVQNNYIDMTVRECVQALRGVAGMIYIKDKTSINANARRTFIDMTREEAVPFLQQLADYADKINQARYALSRYSREKKNLELDEERGREQLEVYKEKANRALRELVEIKVDLLRDETNDHDYNLLSDSDKKNVLRRVLQGTSRKKIGDFLKAVDISTYSRENVWKEFLSFLKDDY